MIRVLIADDHTIFREGLAELLKSETNVEVVGQAATGRETVEQAIELTPDVVLMDIMMPDMNGIEATQHILEQAPEVNVVMLTMLEEDESLLAAMRAGARGYVLKGADKAEVIKSVEAAARGEALFGAAIAGRLTTFFQDADPLAAPTIKRPFPDLTDREREVLALIARGMNNQAIASRLHISPKTVSNHISNIFNKLEVADRAQAIVMARQAGLGIDPGY